MTSVQLWRSSFVQQKNRIIDDICEVNPSAQRGWLDMFSLDELEHYRAHLLTTLEPPSTTRWVRLGDLSAMAMRECA